MNQFTYDILVKYSGANGMDITLPVIGRKWLKPGHTMLIKNATAGIIEAVRKLSVINISMQICTNSTNLAIPSLEIIVVKDEQNEFKETVRKAVQEVITPEPVVEPDGIAETEKEPEEMEPITESDGVIEQDNPEEDVAPVSIPANAGYTMKKGTYKGKALKDIDPEKLESQFRYLPKDDKPEVEKYLKSLKGE